MTDDLCEHFEKGQLYQNQNWPSVVIKVKAVGTKEVHADVVRGGDQLAQDIADNVARTKDIVVQFVPMDEIILTSRDVPLYEEV